MSTTRPTSEHLHLPLIAACCFLVGWVTMAAVLRHHHR